jgi:hypothetical protein
METINPCSQFLICFESEIPNNTFILFSFHLQCRLDESGSKTLLVFCAPAHGLEADQLRYREYCGQARRRLTHH